MRTPFDNGYEDAHDRGMWASGKPAQEKDVAEYRRGFAAGMEDVEKQEENQAARIRTLEAELAQAKADRDVLAKEVRAWRHSDDTHPEGGGPHPQHDRACEAAQRTDASGALSRAGGK